MLHRTSVFHISSCDRRAKHSDKTKLYVCQFTYRFSSQFVHITNEVPLRARRPSCHWQNSWALWTFRVEFCNSWNVKNQYLRCHSESEPVQRFPIMSSRDGVSLCCRAPFWRRRQTDRRTDKLFRFLFTQSTDLWNGGSGNDAQCSVINLQHILLKYDSGCDIFDWLCRLLERQKMCPYK